MEAEVSNKELKTVIVTLVTMLLLFSGAVWLGVASKPLPTNAGATATAMSLSAKPTATATTTTTTAAMPTATTVATAQPKEVKYDYWALDTSKAFKAIEHSCTLGWKHTDMPTGCIIVIDRVGEGFYHDGLSGPFGVVIPIADRGVTIKPAIGWDWMVYVDQQPNRYTFVVIDHEQMYIAEQFESNSPKWDNELLREFFKYQMGGGVETIWGFN